MNNFKDIYIKKPCSVSWEGMEPVDSNNRFCQNCKKVVHDISDLSIEEVIELRAQNGGSICINAPQDLIGKPPPPAPFLRRSARWLQSAALTIVGLFGTVSLAKAQSATRSDQPESTLSTQHGVPKFSEPQVNKVQAESDQLILILVDKLKYKPGAPNYFTIRQSNVKLTLLVNGQEIGTDSTALGMVKFPIAQKFGQGDEIVVKVEHFELKHYYGGKIEVKADEVTLNAEDLVWNQDGETNSSTLYVPVHYKNNRAHRGQVMVRGMY